MDRKFNVGSHVIGEKQPVFIIAELSANHLKNFDIVVNTVNAIKDSGADAIKLQTYSPDTITIDADNDYFKIGRGSLWSGKTLYQLYEEAYMPWQWQPKIKVLANKLGLECFSSPFDKTSVDFLEEMGVPAYKIASLEITDLPLVEYIASKNKPVLLSTGIARRGDIEEALAVCLSAGNKQVALLKCTSVYPAPLDELNLTMIPKLAKDFKCISGISDHTLSISVILTAVALGAKIIEKHFILDRKLGGVDSAFSLEPKEFKLMAEEIRNVEKSLGIQGYKLTERAKETRKFCRSLFSIKDIKKGEVLSLINVASIRPGFGMAPKHLKEIIGKKAKRNIGKGTPLQWRLITE